MSACSSANTLGLSDGGISVGNRSRTAAVALVFLVALLFIATASREALGGTAFLIAAMFLIYIGPLLVGALAQMVQGDQPLPSWIAMLLGASLALIASLLWRPLLAFTGLPALDIAISMLAFASASEVGAWVIRALGFMRRGRQPAVSEGAEAKA